MRKKASSLLKQIRGGIKSKGRAIKTRLVIFSLLQNSKLLLSSFSDKLMGRHNHKIHKQLVEDHGDQQSQRQSIVVYSSRNANANANAMWVPSTPRAQTRYEEETEEMEMMDPGASVIEIVKNSKEEKGEEFKLEDEIDRVADLFIKRFHRQIRMQKQLSLNTTQDMSP